MLENGVRIKSIQAGSLYDVNLGVRDNLDMKDAVLSNSLFLDFMLRNGLNVWKEESTRDVISIDFSYGSRSYEDEMNHLNQLINKLTNDTEMDEDVKNEKLDRLKKLQGKAMDNEHLFDKKSKDALRYLFYEEGVTVDWKSYNRKGEAVRHEPIRYRMLERTAGKAKKGSVIFIREELYHLAHDYLWMGLSIPEHNAPVVEIGVYSSLTTSSIVNRMTIDPKRILVIKDVDSFFKRRCVSIETDEKNHCIAKTIDDYNVKNVLFDGQALIDHSIFPEWAEGYILLRQHFFKAAAFDSNIQMFFRDYFGDEYETATVKDMWGNEIPAKDVLMITTDNAIKWLKFNVSYDYWCERVGMDNNSFGIVKTAHKSKLGDVQRMSYQMVNSLDPDVMDMVPAKTKAYVYALKSDDEVFLDYLRKNVTFSNDFEVLLTLCEHNSDFINSEYMRERRIRIIHNYLQNAKSGRLIQNGDNLVIVGSPYAMLLHSVGEDVEKDDTFSVEEGTIQCYTERFEDGTYLAEFRSPFNSKNNMGYLHNVSSENIRKYFHIGKQCIAVNMQHTDFQARNNGSDMDSDSIYTTDEKNIVECAKRYYTEFPTIDNNIPKEQNCYSSTMHDFALVDNKLAASQGSIGESSNLAQICLSYSYNFPDKKYQDYVCILSVVAQICIDSSKRRYVIDTESEIKRIKADLNITEHGYPVFWSIIHPEFKKEKLNRSLKCPMNSIFRMKVPNYNPPIDAIPNKHFFIKHKDKPDRRICKKVEELIEMYSLELYRYNSEHEDDCGEDYLLLRDDFHNLIQDIRGLNLSCNYMGLMSWLIDRALCITPAIKRNRNKTSSNLNKNRSLLLKTLFAVNKTSFMKCFVSKTVHL